MFVVVTIMLLTGTTCPPVFIITMTVIGFAALARSIYRYMQSYNAYKKKEVVLQEIVIPEVDCEVNCANNSQLQDVFDRLKLQKNEIDERIIVRPPNLFEEEYCEVGRLVCSGFTKAEKNFGECTLGEPRHGEEWWLTLTSLVFSGGMAGVFGPRGVHKMFSAPDDNPNIIPNKELRDSQTEKSSSRFFKNSSRVDLGRAASPVKGLRKALQNSAEKANLNDESNDYAMQPV